GVRPQAKPETSRFPRKELPHMPGSSTTPGWAAARNNAPVHVAFRVSDHVGTRNYLLSRLNGWPMHSPVNASSASSRIPTHDSGPMRLATPSSQRTFSAYSLPVSTGAPEIQLSSRPGPQPFQSRAPSDHPPSLQAETLCHIGRVARPRGLNVA